MTKAKAIDQRIYENLAAFRLALRRFLAFSETATSAVGVTAPQYQALLIIRTQPAGAVTIGDFADQMLLQPHGAVQMIDRLVAAGLAERRHSATDGRSVLVSLTPMGADRVAYLASRHVEELLAQEPLLAESLRRLRQIGRENGEIKPPMLKRKRNKLDKKPGP
jgi:DNA-binding MarR family transcriptional regulator